MKISNSRLCRNMAIIGAGIGLIIAIFGFTLNCESAEITMTARLKLRKVDN